MADAFLEVNDFEFNLPWCWIPDYSDLWGTPTKGADRPIPASTGSRAYERYRDVRVDQFPVNVLGFMDNEGDPIADPRQGLIDHCDFIEGAIGIADVDGPVLAVFHDFQGGTRAALVHPELTGFRTIGPGAGLYVLELVVPGGIWELGGS